MKSLILYLFHQVNDNVINFIKFSLFDHSEYYFVIICNSLDIDCSVLQIPSYVQLIQRENVGFDFAGWAVGLFNNDQYLKYDRFLFINSSVAGPFIPPYFKNPWPDLILFGLNKDIKLFGATINNYGTYAEYIHGVTHHVQSFVFCLDRIGLDICIQNSIFSISNLNRSLAETVSNCEVKMSFSIIQAGYNIGCCSKKYEDVDFRFIQRYPRELFTADIMYDGRYRSSGAHPYETIFIKTNRFINPNVYIPYLIKKRICY